MLQQLRQWLRRRRDPAAGWQEVAGWCEQRRLGFQAAADGQGFAVQGRTGSMGWRLDWGPPERLYVRGRELRLRADLGLPEELHLMVLDRALQQDLERAVVDRVTGLAPSRPDPDMPAEMRWVAAFPRLAPADAGDLRVRYESVASHKEWLMAWVGGELGRSLLAPPAVNRSPLLLMIGGGRVQLRTALDSPTPASLEPWVTLFEQALREARRVHKEMGDPGEPTTLPSLWAVSSEEDGPGR
jgi:hypothetical protein